MRSAITPPSLLGIDRKIAYANKKYHSGWIWSGVFIGFALLKFSGSESKNGVKEDISSIINNNTRKVNESLIKKNGLNLILSLLGFVLVGFLDPVSCSRIRWIIARALIMKGNIKCNEKKRFKVELLIENPPHSHWTISFPK